MFLSLTSSTRLYGLQTRMNKMYILEHENNYLIAWSKDKISLFIRTMWIPGGNLQSRGRKSTNVDRFNDLGSRTLAHTPPKQQANQSAWIPHGESPAMHKIHNQIEEPCSGWVKNNHLTFCRYTRKLFITIKHV